MATSLSEASIVAAPDGAGSEEVAAALAAVAIMTGAGHDESTRPAVSRWALAGRREAHAVLDGVRDLHHRWGR